MTEYSPLYDSVEMPEEFTREFLEIGEHLRHKSRLSLPKRQENLVKNFVNRKIEFGQFTLEAGAEFYRARIADSGMAKLFEKSEMGAPPLGTATSGRMNPEGISYLYVADSPSTAIAEVRPWVGALISVGKFQTNLPLNMVSFQMPDDSRIRRKDEDKDDDGEEFKRYLFSVIVHTLYFSTPAHSHDKHAYLASQYIVELFKRYGVDGLQYNSVLNVGGLNTVLFDVSAAGCIDVSGFDVKKVSYEYAPFP